MKIHLIFILFLTIKSLVSGTVVFSTGDFSGWSADATINGGQTSTDEISGGNPGAYRNVRTSTNSQVLTSHFDAGNVIDPSAVGGISDFDLSIDFRLQTAFGQGMSVGLLAIQDGVHYILNELGNRVTGSVGSGWQNRDITQVSVLGTIVGSGTLDLSSSGSPIILGFYTANSSGNGISLDYDNWNVTVTTPIPEPNAFGVLFGLAALLIAQRRFMVSKPDRV